MQFCGLETVYRGTGNTSKGLRFQQFRGLGLRHYNHEVHHYSLGLLLIGNMSLQDSCSEHWKLHVFSFRKDAELLWDPGLSGNKGHGIGRLHLRTILFQSGFGVFKPSNPGRNSFIILENPH